MVLGLLFYMSFYDIRHKKQQPYEHNRIAASRTSLAAGYSTLKVTLIKSEFYNNQLFLTFACETICLLYLVVREHPDFPY